MKYCLLLVLFLFSCKGGTNKEKEDVDLSSEKRSEFLSINIADVKDEIELPLSELIESLDVIPLENKDEALVKVRYIDVSDNYIGLTPGNKEAYRLFDRKGEYICAVGDNGQGPGEYTSLYSSQLDEVAGRVYLYTYNAKKILTYNLEGKYLEPECIPLPSILPKNKGFINNKEKKVTIIALPFKGDGLKGMCWVQNFEGEILQFIPADKYEMEPDYSNEVYSYNNTASFDFQLLKFYQEKQDTLYHYNIVRNSVEPVFSLNASMDPGEIIYNYIELPLCFMISVNYIQYNVKPETDIGSTKLIMVDKKTHKAHYVRVVNDFLGGVELEPFYLSLCFRNGYFTSAMEPVELKEQLKEVLENKELSEDVKKRVSKLYESLNVNGNNIIMIGELKR